jgi:hypothetical protein
MQAAAAYGHLVNSKTLPTISRPVGICRRQQQRTEDNISSSRSRISGHTSNDIEFDC